MVKLDRLRGWYVRSPRWVQASAGRLLSVVPPQALFGKTFRTWQLDIERSNCDIAFVERRLSSSLGEVFAAARTTLYYAPLLERDGALVAPTLAGLQLLPVLTKDAVRERGEELLAVPRSELDEVSTGGTSSMTPLTFYLDRERSVKEWAFLTSAWGKIGYRLGDRLAVLGYRGITHLQNVAEKPWAWEPGTRELRLSPFRMVPSVMEEYLDLIDRFSIAYFYGYPSALTPLAAYARSVGWTPPASLRGVLLMSEAVKPFQRETMKEGFGGVPVLACYGLSEKVAMASEVVGSPDEYEFEPLYGYAELLDDDGLPLTRPGERGRLVGTGFICKGMPLIRYDTGDLATLVELPSSKNRWRLRARDITSRHCQDYLVTAEGGLIAHMALYPHNLVVRECQFVQEEPGRAVLRLVPMPGVSPSELEELARATNARADGLLKVELEVVDELPRTARGKRRLVVQQLDLAEFGYEEGV